MRIIQPTPDRLPEVLNVVDGANLAVKTERVKSRIETGDVYAAVSEPTGSARDQVIGVVVLDGVEITAIAVRRRRRGQGIGTALVDAVRDEIAGGEREELVADFDEDVRPFWESLDFDVEALSESDRYRGRWSG